jgi:hypothetical protein
MHVKDQYGENTMPGWKLKWIKNLKGEPLIEAESKDRSTKLIAGALMMGWIDNTASKPVVQQKEPVGKKP